MPCRRLDHSSSESLSGSVGEGTLAPAGRNVFQFFCSVSMSVMVFAGDAAYAVLPTASAARALSKVRRSIASPFARNGNRPVSRPGGSELTILQREAQADREARLRVD